MQTPQRPQMPSLPEWMLRDPLSAVGFVAFGLAGFLGVKALGMFSSSPALEPLRPDPRYRELLARMGNP